jgi:hypothetical protein
LAKEMSTRLGPDAFRRARFPLTVVG